MVIELACRFPEPADPWVKIYSLNGQDLSLEESTRVLRHGSDPQFNHGYPGSGPAQLALAICLKLFTPAAAIRLHQQFKEEFLVTVGHDGPTEAQYQAFRVPLDVSKYVALANEPSEAGPTQ